MSAKHSDEVMELEKTGRQDGGCSVGCGGEEEALSMSRKTGS